MAWYRRATRSSPGNGDLLLIRSKHSKVSILLIFYFLIFFLFSHLLAFVDEVDSLIPLDRVFFLLRFFIMLLCSLTFRYIWFDEADYFCSVFTIYPNAPLRSFVFLRSKLP